MKEVITWKPRNNGVVVRREISGKEQEFPDIRPETMHFAMQIWFRQGFEDAFVHNCAFACRHVMFLQHGDQYDIEDY